MTRRAIKVIKHDAPPGRPHGPEELLIRQQKVEAVEKRGMAVTVKTWISQRRENRLAEVADAKRRFQS